MITRFPETGRTDRELRRRKCPLRAGTLGGVMVGCLLGVDLLSSRPCAAQTLPEKEAAPVPEEESPRSDRVVAPRVRKRVDAIYPPEEIRHGHEAEVELFVVVDVEGRVTQVEVARSGGDSFDDAALAAVKQWTFFPATKGEVPIASRISVPFSFRLPKEARPEEDAFQLPTPERRPPPEVPPLSAKKPAVSPGEIAAAPREVVVRGERHLRTEIRSAAEFELPHDVLTLAPRAEGADVLRAAPGVYTARGAGPAVAHNYYLRGFDSEHGQDIELSVGGLPINLPSHIHGQGYADLGFVVSDVVRTLHVREGVSDPSQGDFAVAGSMGLDLGVDESNRGISLRSSYGSFGTFEQLALFAPQGQPEETFGVAHFARTDGFGQNRSGQKLSVILQHRLGRGELSHRIVAFASTAKSDLAGVVRLDDVEQNRICLTCVYPYPTAEGQNALSSRVMAGFFSDYEGAQGDNGSLGLYAGFDSFRLRKNFTGFVDTSEIFDDVPVTGDLVDQRNETLTMGLTGRYRSKHFRPVPWAHGSVELGADGRMDVIDQAQNLIDASRSDAVWAQQIDADLRIMNLSLWGDLDWEFRPHITARLGVRAAVVGFDVDDHLDHPDVEIPGALAVGSSRSSMGVVWGPRASLSYRPFWWLSLMGAYGEGYRSAQARSVEEGVDAPFSKVRSADLGAQANLGPAFSASIDGYYTHLSDDAAFSAHAGHVESVGASRRLGAVLSIITRPWPWMVGSFSATYAFATLLDAEDDEHAEDEHAEDEHAGDEELHDEHEEEQLGTRLPYVPPLLLRADLGAHHVLVENVGSHHLEGRLNLGLTFLSARPLPLGQASAPLSLLDASVGLSWGPLELSMDFFNLLDLDYAALEYAYASDWDPSDGIRPSKARHLAAGPPLSWLLSLGLKL